MGNSRDIYSRKTNLNRCGAVTLFKLSKALGLSIEEPLALETALEQNTTQFPISKLISRSFRQENGLLFS